jgi:inorganic pyrophosphatase
VTYSFDWGFVPGTLGDDGDPLDALVLHHSSTYPGLLLPCPILGMVEIVQREGKGRPEVNNRIIATPRWHTALDDLEEAGDLPKTARKQLEQFFLTTATLTGKRLEIKGWATRRDTEKFIAKSPHLNVAHSSATRRIRPEKESQRRVAPLAEKGLPVATASVTYRSSNPTLVRGSRTDESSSSQYGRTL